MSAIRKLNIDLEKCIGCLACTHICPKGLITCEDAETVRTVRFVASCSEDCMRCADACSETAISLLPSAEAAEGFLSAEFTLDRCTECRTPYATKKMLSKIRASLAERFGPEDLAWTYICPECRRTAEANQASRRGMMIRWPGKPG